MTGARPFCSPRAARSYGYAHRNRSLELAEAIIWLADDDLLLPDHLERIGELWDTNRFDLYDGGWWRLRRRVLPLLRRFGRGD